VPDSQLAILAGLMLQSVASDSPLSVKPAAFLAAFKRFTM